jgi:hypothetical protein
MTGCAVTVVVGTIGCCVFNKSKSTDTFWFRSSGSSSTWLRRQCIRAIFIGLLATFGSLCTKFPYPKHHQQSTNNYG